MYIKHIICLFAPYIAKSFLVFSRRMPCHFYSNGDDATMPSEHDVLMQVLTKGHIYQLDTAIYHIEKISWYLYTLFTVSAEWIKSYYNYKVKPQKYNVAYNLKKNLWTIGAFSTEKIQIRCLQKTYRINANTPFQQIYLPNVCEAYSGNIYIPSTIALTNNDPT